MKKIIIALVALMLSTQIFAGKWKCAVRYIDGWTKEIKGYTHKNEAKFKTCGEARNFAYAYSKQERRVVEILGWGVWDFSKHKGTVKNY